MELTTQLNAVLATAEEGDQETVYLFFDLCQALGYKREYGYTWKGAYNDSLDAGRKIHEEILGFDWTVSNFSLSGEVEIEHRRPLERVYGFSDCNPARAWLICILKALILLEENK